MEVKGYRGNWWIDFLDSCFIVSLLSDRYLLHGEKNVVVLLFLFDTIFVFLLNVFDHHHYEPTSDLMYNLLGLALSTIAIILYLLFSKQKEIESMP